MPGHDRTGPSGPLWLKRLGIALLSATVVFVAIGLVLPNEYVVSRSVVIEAEAEEIHAFVGELRRWETWGPWSEDDPTLVVTYGAKTSGIGANQSWTGKDGKGSLTITASSPRRGVRYDLAFNDGAYRCRAAIRYHAGEGHTFVSWMMRGRLDTPVLGGYAALLVEPLVGGLFERGLAKLKRTVEGRTASPE